MKNLCLLTLMGCSVLAMVSSALSTDYKGEFNKSTSSMTVPLREVVDGPLMPVNPESLALQESYDAQKPQEDTELTEALLVSSQLDLSKQERDLEQEAQFKNDMGDVLYQQWDSSFKPMMDLFERKDLEFSVRHAEIDKISQNRDAMMEERERLVAESKKCEKQKKELSQTLSSLPVLSKLVVEEPIHVTALPMSENRLAILRAVQESYDNQNYNQLMATDEDQLQRLNEERVIKASLISSVMDDRNRLYQKELQIIHDTVGNDEAREAGLSALSIELAKIDAELESLRNEKELLDAQYIALTT